MVGGLSDRDHSAITLERSDLTGIRVQAVNDTPLARIHERDTELLVGLSLGPDLRVCLMSLKAQRQLLLIEIQSPRYLAVFVQARKRRRKFAKHVTVHALLRALSVESSRRFSEKETLACAVLQEHGQRPHPLWAAFLLLACHPMLSRLRGRIYSDHATDDELDQLVVTAFLEVITGYAAEDMRDRTFMRLRQMTHRMVFKRLRHEREAQERVQPALPSELSLYERICLSEHRHAPWPETSPSGPNHHERRAQLAFLKKYAGRTIMREKLDPMIATLVHGERLRQYVKRVHPNADGDAHQRLYELIKRRHSRGMRELRQLLADRREPARTERSRAR